jgi:hypothetical protein
MNAMMELVHIIFIKFDIAIPFSVGVFRDDYNIGTIPHLQVIDRARARLAVIVPLGVPVREPVSRRARRRHAHVRHANLLFRLNDVLAVAAAVHAEYAATVAAAAALPGSAVLDGDGALDCDSCLSIVLLVASCCLGAAVVARGDVLDNDCIK